MEFDWPVKEVIHLVNLKNFCRSDIAEKLAFAFVRWVWCETFRNNSKINLVQPSLKDRLLDRIASVQDLLDIAQSAFEGLTTFELGKPLSKAQVGLVVINKAFELSVSRLNLFGCHHRCPEITFSKLVLQVRHPRAIRLLTPARNQVAPRLAVVR